MKRAIALVLIGLIAGAGSAVAESDTAKEVKETIQANFNQTNETGKGVADSSSKDGTVEFWSSGGLMNWSSGDDPPGEWDSINLTPKHITVIPLGDDAAVAMGKLLGDCAPLKFPVK